MAVPVLAVVQNRVMVDAAVFPLTFAAGTHRGAPPISSALHPTAGMTSSEGPSKSVAPNARHQVSPLAAHKSSSVRLHCSFVGCEKVFSKACKLADHERTHTGERPFVCQHAGCAKSFGRKDHLHRHVKSHALPLSSAKESELAALQDLRPFLCTFVTQPNEVCGRRFLTRQHLTRHIKEFHDQHTSGGEEGEAGRRKRSRRPSEYTCNIADCSQTFAKRKLLRAHINVYHSDKGKSLAHFDEVEAARIARLPFPCTQEGCPKRFPTNSKRMAHVEERHSSTLRYICPFDHASDPTPGGIVQFATWTELLAHQREQHKPVCPIQGCDKEFREQRNLRIHLQRRHGIYDEDEVDLDGAMEFAEAGEGRNARTRISARFRQQPSHLCNNEGCAKTFASRRGLLRHKYKCTYAPSVHTRDESDDDAEDEADVSDNGLTDKDTESEDDFYRREGGAVPECSADRSKVHRRLRKRELERQEASRAAIGIAALTGRQYGSTADDRPQKKRKIRGRVLGCPWREICRLRDVNDADLIAQASDQEHESASTRCDFRFSRLYDVQRHLQSQHDVHLSQLDIRSLLHEEELRQLGSARPGTQISKEEQQQQKQHNDCISSPSTYPLLVESDRDHQSL